MILITNPESVCQLDSICSIDIIKNQQAKGQKYIYYQESAGKGTKLILSKKLKGPDELAVAFHKHLSQGNHTTQVAADNKSC